MRGQGANSRSGVVRRRGYVWTFKIREYENGEEIGSSNWGAIKFKFAEGLDIEIIGNIYENPDLIGGANV